MREELARLYQIPRDKVDVIPNAIHRDIYRFAVDPGEVKRKYGVHPMVPVVLFVGRHEFQKGPDILIDAAPEILRDYPEVRFVFVGQGGMRRDLERRASERGIGGSVSFLGFLSHLEYLEVLNSCDLVCIPSRNEPFGLVLLEAWSAGRPVVATGVGGLRENIASMRDGIIVEPDPHSIAWGVNMLLADPDLMRSFAEEGRRRAEDFGWEGVVASFEETYRRALAGHG
jgi:glycosyltransferase involved in cell wall biosynthesis